MASYLSEVSRPPPFFARSDEYHVETLRDRLPQRWKSGERDSVESIGVMLGEARDHHLYRKVGAESWAEYCATFLLSPPAAMDELIEGVRILVGQGPVSEDAARAEARRVKAAQVAKEVVPTPKKGEIGRGRNRLDIIQPKNQGGTSARTLSGRIKRARPDVAARQEAGEFPSVQAAARAAGIISKSPDGLGKPETVARRIVARGADYADAVVAAIHAQRAAKRPWKKPCVAAE